MKIDLRTAIISPDTNVWRLFPGSNYRFLGSFFESHTAFLDLPSLTLPDDGAVDSAETFARMVAAQKTRENIAQKGIEATPANWEDHKDARRTKTRGRQYQALLSFYSRAKKGDYLIVPSTLSEARVWVGRFDDDVITYSKHGRYGDIAIPSRRVTWLSEIVENKISRPLSQSLRGQHPFSLIERSRFVEVFALANQSFVYGDRHVATILNAKDDFLDADAALIGLVAKLAASASQWVEEGSSGIDHGVLNALVSPIPTEYTCSQESDIHSEGFNRFISAAKTPLVICAVLAVLITLPGDVSQNTFQTIASTIQVENSLAPGDATCGPPVSEATRKILQTIDFDTVRKMCESARESRERAGLTPSAAAEN